MQSSPHKHFHSAVGETGRRRRRGKKEEKEEQVARGGGDWWKPKSEAGVCLWQKCTMSVRQVIMIGNDGCSVWKSVKHTCSMYCAYTICIEKQHDAVWKY